MKKTIAVFALLFIAGFAFAAGYEKVLTEDLSVQTALSINHDVLIQSQNVEYAKQRINESKSLYFPKIDFNLNVSRFNNEEPLVLSEMSPMPVYLPQANKDLYFSTRLSIWQNIYSGGRVRTANKLAEMNMNKVKNEENLVKSKVVNRVKIAFNACLFYKAKLGLFSRKLQDTESKKIKMTQSEINELNSKTEIAQFNYDKEVLNLLSVIGLELNTIVDISGEFEPKLKNIDLNQCLLLAYQFKPELQMTQYQESMDGLMVSLLSLQRYPTVSVGAAQEWIGDRVIGDESSWYVSANVNIPIFDGGGAFSRVKQGKISARQATLKRSQTEEELRLQVSQALLEYNFWKNQVIQSKLTERKGEYTESDLELIFNLNRSYYALELAVGVQLDSY